MLGQPDELRGEMVCAVVRRSPRHRDVTLDELCAFLDERGLMKQKWPERLVIVDEFPLTGLGKVAKVEIGPTCCRRKPMTVLSADERTSSPAPCARPARSSRPKSACVPSPTTMSAQARRSGQPSCGTCSATRSGWPQIALPEHLGGAGYGASALGVVAHELGRVLAPVPFVASAVLATGLLLDAARRRSRRSVCPACSRATHRGGRDHRRRRAVASGRRDAERRHAAAKILAHRRQWSAMSSTAPPPTTCWWWRPSIGEPAVFLLDRTAEGISVVAERVLDGTRPMATITFTGAPRGIRLTGRRARPTT